MSPACRRRAVREAVDVGVGCPAQACRALGASRSGYYRVRKASASQQRLGQRIVALSRAHPRYGYRRVTALHCALPSHSASPQPRFGKPRQVLHKLASLSIIHAVKTLALEENHSDPFPDCPWQLQKSRYE